MGHAALLDPSSVRRVDVVVSLAVPKSKAPRYSHASAHPLPSLTARSARGRQPIGRCSRLTSCSASSPGEGRDEGDLVLLPHHLRAIRDNVLLVQGQHHGGEEG